MASLAPLTRRGLASRLQPALLGMVHLPALPGSPSYGGDPDLPLRRALEDARHLVSAGFTALMVENYGDIPFFRGAVPPVTIAALSRVVGALRAEYPSLFLGVNVLRNDAAAALSIAAANRADAVRINAHCGAAVTDQGLIQGEAASSLRLRVDLASSAGQLPWILADLQVKHAVPLAVRDAVEEALDLRERGLADAILLTGSGTGRPAEPKAMEELREALPECPFLVASGVDATSAAAWQSHVDGAIVGSTLMVGGKAGAGVDLGRAKEFLEAWGAVAPASTSSSHRMIRESDGR